MLIRYCGGPLDGQTEEVPPEMTIIRTVQPEVEYRAIKGWDPAGYRYFVHQDFRGSLISDEDVRVAAEWMADQRIKDPRLACANGDSTPFVGYYTYLAEKMIRSPEARPDVPIGLSDMAHPVVFSVEIRPGLIRARYRPHDNPFACTVIIRDTRPQPVVTA